MTIRQLRTFGSRKNKMAGILGPKLTLRKRTAASLSCGLFGIPWPHKHNVRGKDRVHLMRKISDCFDEYLKK